MRSKKVKVKDEEIKDKRQDEIKATSEKCNGDAIKTKNKNTSPARPVEGQETRPRYISRDTPLQSHIA